MALARELLTNSATDVGAVTLAAPNNVERRRRTEVHASMICGATASRLTRPLICHLPLPPTGSAYRFTESKITPRLQSRARTCAYQTLPLKSVANGRAFVLRYQAARGGRRRLRRRAGRGT